MATAPDTHDFATGASSSTEANGYIRDPIRFLRQPPMGRFRANAAQSIANATWVSVALQVDDNDSAGGHDTAVNNSRYTAQYDGWYQVSGGVAFAASATGRRMTRWAVNGALVEASGTIVPATAASTCNVPASTELVFLSIGDYLELQAFQESGGALNISAVVGNENNSRVNVIWVSA